MTSNSLGLSLTDILFLLGIQSRTGELVIESGNNIGTMLLHEGKILQAFSPYSRAIGDLLVEEGLISDTELIETLKVQKRSAYMPLGALLLKMGRVTVEVVESMVHAQIRQSVKEFQTWKKVNFNFNEKGIEPFDRIHLPVQEFLSRELLESVKTFLSVDSSSRSNSATATTATNQ